MRRLGKKKALLKALLSLTSVLRGGKWGLTWVELVEEGQLDYVDRRCMCV